jgi:hypothetical protein
LHVTKISADYCLRLCNILKGTTAVPITNQSVWSVYVIGITTAMVYKCGHNVLFSERNVQYRDYVVVEVNGDTQHGKRHYTPLLLLLQHLAADY